ncbi:MAG: hypothetical protein A3F72_16605 [Bacteroidetes bacterium RIFCSPLOWO2_12_FULL_35_15]|nr:MAG: hypothetical protein A3F72_16605 [Bacteroidetes bacterium RIFCSPLOWO2_12_FULL_35_15]
MCVTLLIEAECRYNTFGAVMPGRSWPTQTAADNTSAGTKPYRYGFNGKESDFEIKDIGGSSYDYGARMYDPRLGRWLATDPFAAKYPSMSPYVFGANNPILFIDPDGKTIIITGTADYTTKTFAVLQSLTNEKLVLLSNGTVIQANKLPPFCDKSSIQAFGSPVVIPERNTSKPEGTSLVNEVINSNHVVTIEDAKAPDYGNHTFPNSFDAQEPGVGDGSRIEFDHYDDDGGFDVNLDRTRPIRIALAHELLHARRSIRGLFASNKIDSKDSKGRIHKSNILPNAKDPDNGGEKGRLTKEEVEIRKEENKIRDEQNVPDRLIPQVTDEK